MWIIGKTLWRHKLTVSGAVVNVLLPLALTTFATPRSLIFAT